MSLALVEPQRVLWVSQLPTGMPMPVVQSPIWRAPVASASVEPKEVALEWVLEWEQEVQWEWAQ